MNGSLSVSASKQQSAQVRGKFYERFNQILDRVFGSDATSKRKYGGWLDYSAGAAMATSTAAAVSARKKRGKPAPRSLVADDDLDDFLDSLSANGRAIAALLGTGKDDEGSIFQFLFRVSHPVEFKLELDMLPEQSKMSIMSRSSYTSVLFTQLLHKPLAKQAVDPRNPALLVTIKELYLFYFLRHPSSASHQSSPALGSPVSAPGTSASSSTPGSTTSSSTGPTLLGARSSSIMGSISESFAKPKPKVEHSWRLFFNDGVASLTKGNPYNVLLLQYLRGFLPDSNKPVKSRFHAKILQQSNQFLHILIEFWLRQNLIVFSDEPTAGVGVIGGGVRPPPIAKLVSPFASVHTYTSYMPPSDDLLSSLLLTIIHLLSDSFYPAALVDGPAAPGSIGGGSAHGYSHGYGGSHMAPGGSSGSCLTPSVTVLRRPLYEFFRLVFSRAPIGLSPTAFLAITDVWLAYIQPWSCRRWAECKVTTTATEASASEEYTPAWESYVLANYHFYTTLLGAFVERAKELDFSGADVRNVSLLDRVLSVYNGELLSLLRRASQHFEKSQPYHVPFGRTNSFGSGGVGGSVRGKTRSIADSDDDLSSAQSHVLTFYSKALGIECVPVTLHDSFHRDAERLFDRLWSSAPLGGETSASPASAGGKDFYDNVSSVFRSAGSTTTSSKKPAEKFLETVQRLSRMLRRVFEISDAYVASTAHSRSSAGALPATGLESLDPSRDSRFTHLLSRRGIYQLKNGLRLCSPDSVQYLGDPMLRPICTFEIPLLVRLSYRFSTWLNAQLGLKNPYHGKRFDDNVDVDPAVVFASFRFNFRFLASKINLAFLAAFLFVLYAVYFW